MLSSGTAGSIQIADGDRWQVDLTRRYRTVRQLNQLVRPPKRPQNGRVPAELSALPIVDPR